MIENKIKRLIYEVLNVNFSIITSGASLIDGLGADSLEMIEIVTAVEEKFDIDINDDDMEKIVTVDNLFKLVKNKIK